MFKKIEKKIIKLIIKLFPLCRSLTGNDTLKTLKILKNINKKLIIKKVKSGKKIFDWTVPLEWNVKNAWIKDENNRKIVDFKKNNLHLMGYSTPIYKKISFLNLKKNIYSFQKRKNAIPYVTSYYKKNWGFCMSYNQLKKMNPKYKYTVFIDSSLKKGYLNYGEIFVKGSTKKEILFSTYICHPSMANNELSGPSLLIYLSKWVASKKRKYSYRFIFIPETIGSLIYIKNNFKNLKKNTCAAFNVTCVGDNRNYSLLFSRLKNSFSDSILKNLIYSTNIKFKIYNWLDRGSDERNFNAPGVDIPMVSLMRSKYGEYPEYHSSDDKLFKVVTAKGIKSSFDIYKLMISKIEKFNFPLATNLGEPMLSKRNLYHNISKPDDIPKYVETNKILNVLSFCDGKHFIEEISSKCELPLNETTKFINLLEKNKLIVKLNTIKIN